MRLAIRVVDELSHRHAGIAGQIEGGAVSESNSHAAIASGREHIAEINGITDFGLTRLITESRLHDNRSDVLDCNRASRGNHFADGFYRNVALCPRRHVKKANRRQNGTRCENGNCMRTHRPTLLGGCPWLQLAVLPCRSNKTAENSQVYFTYVCLAVLDGKLN